MTKENATQPRYELLQSLKQLKRLKHIKQLKKRTHHD